MRQVDRGGSLGVMGAGHHSPQGGSPETGNKEGRDKEMDTSVNSLNTPGNPKVHIFEKSSDFHEHC